MKYFGKAGKNDFGFVASVLFIACIGSVRGPNVTDTQSLEDVGRFEVECVFHSNLALGSRERELQCCNTTDVQFRQMWARGTRYLTRYLEKLRAWQCQQFDDQCVRRTYAYNEFTSLIYDYFCNKTALVEKCFERLNATLSDFESSRDDPPTLEGSGQLSSSQFLSEWNSSVYLLSSRQLSLQMLADPCVQVALYDVEGNKTDYHEVVHVDIPACELVWCGFDGDAVRNQPVSAWVCMTQGCRNGLIVIIAICVILALLISIFNLTVIIVIVRNPGLRHSQAIYKLSLAFADLLVGLIVFPTFISTMMMMTTERHQHGALRSVEAFKNETGNNETLEVRDVGGRNYNKAYLNFVGFVTTVSFTSSIYCLMVAGIDRVKAVRRPLQYRKDRAKLVAKWVSLVVWICAIFFASLPWYVPTLDYVLIVSFLVSLGGSDALILYAVSLAIPLVAMWVLSIATFCFTRKHAHARRHLTKDSKYKTKSIEYRLARTLSLMVGAFTLSIVPAVIMFIVPLFTPTIYYNLPQHLDLTGAAAFRDAEFAAVLFLACNSLWNFFIYSARNVEFRKAVKVFYGDLADTVGLTRCWSATASGIRRAAHDGRRRLSSLPTITYSSASRKKSLSTELTTMSKFRKSSLGTAGQSTEPETTTLGKTSQSATNESSEKSVGDSSKASESVLESEKTENYQAIYTKKQKRKGKRDEESDVTDDSIFRSFAVDVHADRLYLSVMENIDEEIETAEENPPDKANKEIES